VNVYVESNFVLELALLQEQQASCEGILRLSEEGGIRLVIPAYSLMEPYDALGRRQAERRDMKSNLDSQFREIARTVIYKDRLHDFQNMTSLLVDSAEEDMVRLESVRSRLIACADLVSLEASVLSRTAMLRTRHGLSAQDAVVYASILTHLESSAQPGCFITRDSDFDDPDIKQELKDLSCKLLTSFDIGLQFLRRPASETAPP
jgi:predicted nucleic acid-binding protein